MEYLNKSKKKILEDIIVTKHYCDTYEERVRGAAEFIRHKMGRFEKQPLFGIVLGTGLGEIADSIEEPAVIPYSEIPDFPKTTVPGHEGKLIVGELEGVPLIGLKGRKHFYEVADEPFDSGTLQVVFPVHVLAELGVKNYFATNAVGGLNPEYETGDVMVIKSHVNLIPNPLLGRYKEFTRVDDGELCWRFQPMNEAYDRGLMGLLHLAGEDHGDSVHEGVLLSTTGPTYESEAEAVAYRDQFGADVVGMSVTPEVIVARNRGMRCVGMSCITNVIAKDGTNATNHEEVKAILDSEEVKGRLTSIVKGFFNLYSELADRVR